MRACQQVVDGPVGVVPRSEAVGEPRAQLLMRLPRSGSRRAVITTFASASPSPSAISLPRPRDPPVTMATLPPRSNSSRTLRTATLGRVRTTHRTRARFWPGEGRSAPTHAGALVHMDQSGHRACRSPSKNPWANPWPARTSSLLYYASRSHRCCVASGRDHRHSTHATHSCRSWVSPSNHERPGPESGTPFVGMPAPQPDWLRAYHRCAPLAFLGGLFDRAQPPGRSADP